MVAVFITIIIGIVGVLYFFGQQQKAREAARQATWTVTTAQVTGVGWQTYEKTKWKGTNYKGWSGKNYKYKPTLDYRYTVKGVAYGRQRVQFAKRSSASWQAFSAPNGFHAQHPVGSTISIRFNPDQPSESVVYPPLE